MKEDKITNKPIDNKMGKDPIGRLLFKMSIPAIFSMLIQALYNIVDSMYVSRISLTNNDALNALSLVFPLQMLQLAVALGIGVGTNSVIARRLGAKLKNEASNYAKTGLVLAVIAFLFFFSLSWFIPKLFISFLDKGFEIETMIVEYLSIIMMFSIFMFIEIVASKILQATGNMIIPMIAQLIGAITNIILDPIFIFGPNKPLGTGNNFLNFNWGLGLGVKGAAIATVIAQGSAMLFTLIILFFQNHEVDFSFSNFKLKGKRVQEILRVGAPVILMNSIGSVTVLTLNFIIAQVYDGAEAILGTYFKLQSFVFMPVFGLTQGAMPIMGYNYGANIKNRFHRTLLLSIISSILIMIVGMAIFQFYPKFLLTIINITGEYYDLAIIALKIISWSFIGASINIVLSVMFQAVGQGLKSLLMTLLRQVIILIPLAFILSSIFNSLSSIWVCYPIAEVICLIIFAPIALKTISNLFITKKADINLELINY